VDTFTRSVRNLSRCMPSRVALILLFVFHATASWAEPYDYPWGRLVAPASPLGFPPLSTSPSESTDDLPPLGQALIVQPNPSVFGKRLDFCFHWGRDCGKPAADAYCRHRMNGNGVATSFVKAENIGSRRNPTWVMGDNLECRERECDGFAEIGCGRTPISACERAFLDRAPSWGGSAWSGESISRLCGTSPAMNDQPVQCFERLMSGAVSWGGGSTWQPNNALDLCERTNNLDATISCFSTAISAGVPWSQAVQSCGI
jgi:hypothetical protein